MTKTLNILVKDIIKPIERFLSNGNLQKNKRRGHKFFEKLLILYYFKSKVPTDMLKCKFWIEHISAFSSSWKDKIDIDRLGNIIPIISEINQKRGNKHIKEYNQLDTMGFMQYIKDMIPAIEIYDRMVKHEKNKSEIIDNGLYDEICTTNETNYINNFLKSIF